MYLNPLVGLGEWSLQFYEVAYTHRSFCSQDIKRIGITSSCAAIIEETRPGIQDESSWNESSIMEVQEKWREARPIAKYLASKTLAEKGTTIGVIWYFLG